MGAFRSGDKQAASDLVEMFYPQLRRLANSRMQQERANHSWQPTVLVNELYLELLKVKALKPPDEDADEKTAFFRLAAHLMRRLLIHHSRPLAAKATKVAIAEDDITDDGLESVTAIEQALERLDGIRPRLRAIVELRVFEGLTGDEIAERLECATATVAREWNFAKHWLQQEFPQAARAVNQ